MDEYMRQQIVTAWIQGYYHAGYTHDSAYSDKMAAEYVAGLPAPAQPLAAAKGLPPEPDFFEALKHLLERFPGATVGDVAYVPPGAAQALADAPKPGDKP